MGQATILSHLGGGLYRVKLQFANGLVTARIALIGLQITALDAQIADLETQKNAAYADLQTALDAMNAYLGSVTPEQLATDPTEINALTKEAFTARAHYDTLAMRWRMAKSKKTALETNRSYLQNYCPSDIEVDAWSVRFNEDLTNYVVATIEVDYVLQRNSGTGQAVVNDSGVWLFPGAQFDSILQHPLASSEHATWFNLGILPAMQRDAPRYRVATLSNLDKLAGTCTVTFDGSSSFDGNKLVSANPIYPHGAQSTEATISYPPCDGAAFENGDRVIVAGGNVVIGFYSHPRKCQTPMPASIQFILTRTFVGEPVPVMDIVYFSDSEDPDSCYVGEHELTWPTTRFTRAAQPLGGGITVDGGEKIFDFDRELIQINGYQYRANFHVPKVTLSGEFGAPAIIGERSLVTANDPYDCSGNLLYDPVFDPSLTITSESTSINTLSDSVTAHDESGNTAVYTAYAIDSPLPTIRISYIRNDLL